MAGLYALAAAFFASFSVVYVLFCTFTSFLGCGYSISITWQPLAPLAFCILYYNYTTRSGRGGGNIAARVEGRDRGTIGDKKRARAAAFLSPRASGPRPACAGRSPRAALAGRERGQGLCYV